MKFRRGNLQRKSSETLEKVIIGLKPTLLVTFHLHDARNAAPRVRLELHHSSLTTTLKRCLVLLSIPLSFTPEFCLHTQTSSYPYFVYQLKGNIIPSFSSIRQKHECSAYQLPGSQNKPCTTYLFTHYLPCAKIFTEFAGDVEPEFSFIGINAVVKDC